MAFEVYVGDRPLAPEHTTLEQYNLYRLGSAIILNTAFSETIDERLLISSSYAEDSDNDGLFETIHTTAFNDGEPLPLSGSPISKLDGSILGYVTSSVLIAEEVSASIIIMPQHYAITLTSGSLTSGSAVLVTRRVNTFGNISHVPSLGGRNWVFTLRSNDSTQKNIMQSSMFKIMTTTIATALTELGLSKTSDEIQAAALSLAQRGITIDSLIVDELENLEKGRRDGTYSSTELGISGTPPTII